MHQKLIKFCMVLSFLGTVLLSVVLYAEKQNHDQTDVELQKIVLQDFTQTETFFRLNPDEMQSWAEYLELPEAQKVLSNKGPEAKKRLLLLMNSLYFAQGAEKYPVLVNLYESLNSLQNWRHQNFVTATFHGKNLLSELQAKRSSEKNVGSVLLCAAGKLSAEKKMELEKEFFAQLETRLPDDLVNFQPQTMVPMVAKSSTVQVLESEKSLEMTRQTVGPVSPLHRKNKAMQTGTGSGGSSYSQPENTSQSQSGSIQNSMPYVLRSTVVPLPSFLGTRFIPTLMDSGNFVKNRELAEVNEVEPSEESQDSLTLPDLPSTTKNQPQACDDVNAGSSREARKIGEKKAVPDDSIPELNLEETEETKSEETGSSSEVEAADETAQSILSEKSDSEKVQSFSGNDFLPLPFLHYSLVETVGKIDGTIPKYEGKEPLEELQKGVTGDFTKDLERVRQCWLAETFRVPSDEDAAVAYEAIGVASDCVSKVLNRLDEKKRASWVNLLHLNQLDLNKEPNLALLQEVYNQLSCGKIGLEMEIFVNFRESIRHFLALVYQQQNPEKGKELFETARFRVFKLLELVEKERTNIYERALEDELVLLDCMGQANATVQATRLMWNQPNVFINVDSSIFERYGSRVIEEEENILNDVSRATIRGKALFNGNLTVKPVVNENRVELEIVLDGASDSRTRAFAGPAIISSRAKSRVLVQKSIYFDEAGFESDAADVQIRTNSQIEKVQDVRNRAIIQNIATRRAYAQKNSLEQSTNAQSSRRLRQRFDSQINPILENWNKQISILFQKHFRPRGLDQNMTHTHSDAAGVYVQTQLTCRNAMSACVVPPEMPQKSEFQIAIHETMIQNAFSGYFSGLNLNAYARQHIKNTSPSFVQNIFKGESATEDSNENWTIHFPEAWPVSVSFQDGKVCCVVHIEQLNYEGKSYPAVDITVYYRIEARPDGFYLVRDGNIGIFPPDFNPEQKKRLPPSMISLRRVLGKRLEKEIVPEIVLKEQKLVKNPEKQDSSFGNLWMKPAFIQAKDGWLMIGMNLIEKEPCK